MGKLLLLSALVLVLGILIYFKLDLPPKVDFEKFKQSEWFGDDSPKVYENNVITPFKVNIPESHLRDLNRRLKTARFTDNLADTQFNYGFNSNYLKKVVEYWRTKYNWSREESKLNTYPQFLTRIEGLNIHFIHAKPTKPAKTVLPILVIHGWPGSVVEYYKSIPLLIEPDEAGLAFEVIAVSIPGFGFSEAPKKKGFNIVAATRIFVKLMARLGHDKFISHGGDWGHAITRFMGSVYPEKLIGVHMLGNWDSMEMMDSFSKAFQGFLAAYFPRLVFGLNANITKEQAKIFPLWDKIGFFLSETGYYHLQATKPDTIGAALTDTPVGLAAYILEKFSTWTNPANLNQTEGGLVDKFTIDELLTNVMIYWWSGNAAASLRFYKENIQKFDEISGLKVIVPAATVDAPYDFIRTPRALIESNFENLLQYTELPTGGHFTAFEEPQLVCDDIRQFVRKVLEQQKKLA